MNIKEEKISDERLTTYSILDIYNLINKENKFNKDAFVKSSSASERTIRRDIKCLNDYFKRNYEDKASVGICREINKRNF